MSIKLTNQKALSMLEDMLMKNSEVTLKEAKNADIYKALAMLCRDVLLNQREKFHSKVAKSSSKRVHYLCLEFLLGRNLKSTLFNLKLDSVFANVLKENKEGKENSYWKTKK